MGAEYSTEMGDSSRISARCRLGAVLCLAFGAGMAAAPQIYAANVDLPDPSGPVAIGAVGSDSAADSRAQCENNQSTIEIMLAVLPHCDKNARFLAALGYSLNQRGRFQDALDHLERALLLDPSLKGAQIDYAIALAGSGEIDAAQALLSSLLLDPDLPPALRPLLVQQVRQMDALLQKSGGPAPGAAKAAEMPVLDSPAHEGRSWRHVLAIRAGRDSNLLGAPDLSSLSLTFPDLTVILPLEESFRAKAGLYARGELQVEMRQRGEQGLQYEARAMAQANGSPQVPQSNSHQFELAFERSRLPRLRKTGTGTSADEFDLGHYIQVSAAGLSVDTGVRYRSTGFGVGVEWVQALLPSVGWDACIGRFGGDLQDRRVDSNSILSGRYIGISSQWRCVSPTGVVTQLSAQAGRDIPTQPERPGGQQNQYGLRFSAIWPLEQKGATSSAVAAKGARLQLDLDYTRSKDRSGYSVILENGTNRNVARYGVRWELTQPLSAGWEVQLGANWLWQASNIVLFEQRSWGPYLAFRLAW